MLFGRGWEHMLQIIHDSMRNNIKADVRAMTNQGYYKAAFQYESRIAFWTH